MSGVTKDDQIGRVEEDQHLGHQQQTPLQGGNPPFPGEDSDGDEEEAITEVSHSHSHRCLCFVIYNARFVVISTTIGLNIITVL